MPQLGETVTEGTITRWFKQVGESVQADEPLFEVSTDKVDSEVPAPSAGVVSEILVPEGETVPVGARLAVIGDAAGGAPSAAPSEPATDAAPSEQATETAAEPAPAPPPPQPQPQPSPQAAPPPAPAAPPTPAPQPARVEAAPPMTAPATPPPAGNGGGVVTSPLVRRLIAENGLDATQINGTGEGGRITRNDVLSAARGRGTTTSPPAAPTAPAPATPSAPAPAAAASPASAPAAGDTVVPFDNIRRRTAEHMVRSKATSAHVYTSVEVDFERVERVRRLHQAAWKAEEGFSLTYLPFIVRAVSDIVHEYPNVNASVDSDSLLVHRDLHLGIAVDLDFHGLVAPVIRNADGKRLRLIAREIRDLARRAKSKQLTPDEVVGGTFTITNMGPFGTLLTLPIINQPQVAILATDAVRKQPVVVEGPDGEDSIAIHHVGHLALAWDHRAFDGAYAASFLNSMREVLETRDWEAELA
ncbi:MAG: hypothetical protein QOI55_270 [Actinomycetota bacterium]|nr:hypothetical protein [Actinomycetota bacterium]